MPLLRIVRRNQLLSQRDLAKKAHITPSTIYLIETGRTRPRLKVMRAICEALAVSPQQIDEFHAELERTPATSHRVEAMDVREQRQAG
jgi:DNA-binding XRE family transcriptional regulator